MMITFLTQPLQAQESGTQAEINDEEIVYIDGSSGREPLYSVSNTGEAFPVRRIIGVNVEVARKDGNFMVTSPGYEGTGTTVAITEDVIPLSSQHSQGAFRVIGVDDRVLRTVTTAMPSSGVVEIRTSLGNCTGWLYDDNHIATAGHCVFDYTGGRGWANNATVYPGRNGSNLPFGSCGALEYRTNSVWTTSGNPDYDYGIIKLNCNVGNQTGWFGYRMSSSAWTGTNTYLTAYHSDLNSHTTQWETYKPITITNSRRLYYKHDFTLGASGGPVYYRPGDCPSGCAIAINAQEYAPPTDNSGVRIESDVFYFLENHK